MPRYTDTDALINAINDADIIIDTVKFIRDFPTADVVERKRGKWQVCGILDYAQRPTGRKVGRCPFCEFLTGEFITLIECNRELTNFCPNCGARMDESKDDD